MKNMPPQHDLRGQRFGRLVVTKWHRTADMSHGKWLCLCDCGTWHVATTKHLRRGDVKSCGCLARQLSPANKTHGSSRTGLYRVWLSMRRRCENPSDPSFKNYGGRGIKVCDRWNRSFEAFVADMGERPASALTVERIDNDGNYEPGNCKWATRQEQARNQRSNRLIEHDGRVQCLARWAEEFGIGASCLRRRLDVQGLPIAEALTRTSRYSLAHKRMGLEGSLN